MSLKIPAILLLTLVAVLQSCSGVSSGASASSSTAPKTLPLPFGITAGLKQIEGAPKHNFERINATWSVVMHQPAIIKPGESVTLAGWAADPSGNQLASAVDVAVDGVPYKADYGVIREDVAGYFRQPGLRDSGFRLLIQAGMLAKGPHRASVRVVPRGGGGYQESGTVLFTVQ